MQTKPDYLPDSSLEKQFYEELQISGTSETRTEMSQGSMNTKSINQEIGEMKDERSVDLGGGRALETVPPVSARPSSLRTPP
ncbi:hypothetical protein D5086_014285 [Populus alba]|uniref:Uncharacterized protein n=1 Tax=Populus alba TaxID=43335 RepID=A0ACC4BYK4_POPAL